MDTKLIAGMVGAVVLGAGGMAVAQTADNADVVEVVSEYKTQKIKDAAWQEATELDNRRNLAREAVATQFQERLDSASSVEERAKLIEELTAEANKAADAVR